MFKFDYEIILFDEKDSCEVCLREEKFEEEEMREPMFSFIDLQGAYLADIDKERYLINNHLVGNIMDRLDAYINDYVFNEFCSELEHRNVNTNHMMFEEMWIKAKELNLSDSEVGYDLASYIIHPESIQVDELEKNIALLHSIDNKSLCEKIKTAENQIQPKENVKDIFELQK